MKFPILAYAVAGVSIAQYAVSSPLRVIMVPNPELPKVRYGHAVSASNANIAHISEMARIVPMAGPVPGRPSCKGVSRYKEKISNIFRQALGLPLFEEHPYEGEIIDISVKHMPASFMETPPIWFPSEVPHPDHPMHPGRPGPPGHPGGHHEDHHHPHGHRKHHHHHHHGKFLGRIHNALMSLGPWEGRAVAFVLGCGIGVLLRMFWMIALITYRSVRGIRNEPEYIEIICEEYTDAEDIFVAPPEYIVDEKIDPDAKKPIVEA